MIGSKRASTFVALLLLAIVGPMCGSGGGGGGGGGTPGGGATFSVVSNKPVQGATGVSRTATIYVKVNGNVNPASLTTSTVTLTGLGPITINTPVWNPMTSQIEITPTTAMDINALHTVNLTAGVMTTGGASLVPNSFTFTTVNSTDITRPTFGGITSITGATTTQVTVNWTQGTDNISAQANLLYEVFLAVATNNQDFGTALAVPNVTGAGSLLISGLTPNTTYFIKVRCKDQAGNQDSNTAEQFKKSLVSFNTNIYTPIVNNICVTCHAPGGVSQFMDLTGGSSAARLKWVNVDSDKGAGPPQMCQANTLKRVLPGDPSNSLVYLKISMTTPPCGVQMPEGLPPLSTAQQQLFFDWITEGALDN